MKKLFILIIISALFLSCGVGRHITVLNRQPMTMEKVEILNVGQSIPEGVTLVGNVSLGEGGWTSTSKCKYEELLATAMIEAQKMGGNLIYVREHKIPDNFLTTCHSIVCDVYLKKADGNK